MPKYILAASIVIVMLQLQALRGSNDMALLVAAIGVTGYEICCTIEKQKGRQK